MFAAVGPSDHTQMTATATLETHAAAAATQAVWRQHYATPAGERRWPCEELVRFLGRRPGPHACVLEVGCGNGANLWALAEHAGRVVGVDISREALMRAAAYMRERGVEDQVELVEGDAFRLQAADGSVDLLVDAMVSQHVPWRRHAALYREYRRVLRPGGLLFVYHLGKGTTATGAHYVDLYTVNRLPALFPTAGLTCLPEAKPLRQVVGEAGFAVLPTRSQVRTYPGQEKAVYHVIEGEAA